METPVVALCNVSYDYRLDGTSFRALKDVSLTIHKGEYCAIIGASGSGKTTLMNLLGLMTHPTQGQLFFDGQEISALDSDKQAELRSRKIGFVFQSFHLLPRLSVLDNVTLPAHYGAPCLQDPADRARELLAKLDISSQVQKLPTALSGGQKQRVAMARALFANPLLILADEPTGALDSKTTESVLNLFAELHAQGATIVIITHNPEVARRARRVVRIADGRILEDTAPEGMPVPRVEAPHERREAAPSPFHRARRFATIGAKYGRILLDSILANRGRSFLTVFGLSVGIVAIVVMMTLTKEAKTAFNAFASTMGGNRAIVMFDMRESERLGTRRWRGLDTVNELPAVASLFSRQGDIDPIVQAGNCSLSSATTVLPLGVSGLLSQASFGLMDAQVAHGRPFTLSEYQNPQLPAVALLGKEAAQKLFPKSDPGYSRRENYPVGEVIFSSGCSFSGAVRVVGILAERDADFGADANETVYIPSRMLTSRGVKPFATFFQLNPRPGVKPSEFAQGFKNYLALRTGNRFPFRHFTAEQALARVNTMLNVMQGITVLIGGLCTLIGGIGVMNIMLVSITERIKEIGIRKAVGARSTNIRNQFLGESLLFCALGGLTGVLVGVLLSNAIVLLASRFLPKYVTFTFSVNTTALAWAIATSVISGIAFGIMPALRASRLDVVDALRSD